MTNGASLALTQAFLGDHPIEAGRAIEFMPHARIIGYLDSLDAANIVHVVNGMTPMVGAALLGKMPGAMRLSVLGQPARNRAAALLSQLPESERATYLQELPEGAAKQISEILAYPPATAGRLMSTMAFSLPMDASVTEALAMLRVSEAAQAAHKIMLLDDDNKLVGAVDFRRLAIADADATLRSLMTVWPAVASPLDPQEEVVNQLEAHRLQELPVIDLEGRVLGVVRQTRLIDALKDEATLDIQTMVGVSKDERALSSSWFALRKRMPWLQINLLTAFLAASVVSLFEHTIATYTALAILLPVVAGQSGNAGAQALAVTMRGLALREITIGHWFRVMRKEMNAGLWNGLAIAATCGIGVFVWSGSVGLVMVIAISMVISMVSAGIAGALVPIVLSRLGQDPAVASSIILTTVTDVAGFFSFLGIATLLSSML